MEQTQCESQYNFNKRVHKLQHASLCCKKIQGPQDSANSQKLTEGLLKIQGNSVNNMIERKKLMSLLTQKANGFMFSLEMAQMFDMLLQDENYGLEKVKTDSVLLNYILISQNPINVKLYQMLSIIAPSKDDQYSVRQATNALVRLEQHMDPRIRNLELDSSLAEGIRAKMNPELNYLNLQELVETVNSSPSFYPIQQFMLAIEQEYKVVPTPEQFAEIYNRPSPNQSFNMGQDNSVSENNSFMMMGADGNVLDKSEERKCQCSIF